MNSLAMLEEQRTLDFAQVRRFLKQSFPFLMVDRVLALYPGERVVALKNVTGNEPHFQGHFPDYAIMPGVMILEMLAQTAGLLNWTADAAHIPATIQYLGSANVSFHQPVLPGDQLIGEVSLKRRLGSLQVVSAVARVADKTVARGEIVLASKPEA
jgi:3-hydroxyacyl-[acyl-carrier-protein] dehydratase